MRHVSRDKRSLYIHLTGVVGFSSPQRFVNSQVNTMLFLAFLLLTTGSVWSIHATADHLTKPPVKEGCIVHVDGLYSDKVIYSGCGNVIPTPILLLLRQAVSLFFFSCVRAQAVVWIVSNLSILV
jgi:hypothetical protein